MNKKLIAVAVSSALAAPVIAQAEGEVKVYGRINQAIDLKDQSGSDSDTDVSSVSSRFGIRYDNDLGNGLAVHGRYEFFLRPDRELANQGGQGNLGDIRIGTVGISGAFGRLDVGNQWSAYFNTFGTFVSPTYTLGYYIYSSAGGGPFRASNTLKYSNTFGPVYFELDGRLNGSDEGGNVAEGLRGDGIGAGITFAVGDYVSIGLAADYEDGPDSSDIIESVGKAAQARLTAARQARAEAERLAVPGDVTAIDTARARPMTTEAERTAAAAALTAAIEVGADGSTQRINAQRYSDSLDEQGNSMTAVANAADAARTDDTTRYGIAVKVKLGELPVSVTGGWQNVDTEKVGLTASGSEAADSDVDTWFLWFSGSFTESTSWLLGYTNADGDGDDGVDADQFTWGVYHTIGGGLKVYYEAVSVDDAPGFDGNRHLLGLRVDF